MSLTLDLVSFLVSFDSDLLSPKEGSLCWGLRIPIWRYQSEAAVLLVAWSWLWWRSLLLLHVRVSLHWLCNGNFDWNCRSWGWWRLWSLQDNPKGMLFTLVLIFLQDSVMDVRQFLLDAPETCYFTHYELLFLLYVKCFWRGLVLYCWFSGIVLCLGIQCDCNHGLLN